MKIKALTLHQPWATAVVSGAKKVETRSWRSLSRGLLAIHSSKRFDPMSEPVIPGMSEEDIGPYLPRGEVLGLVEVVSCFPTTAEEVARLSEVERSWGDYGPGRWGWNLKRLWRFERGIPARGRQGLWNWEVPFEFEDIVERFLSLGWGRDTGMRERA